MERFIGRTTALLALALAFGCGGGAEGDQRELGEAESALTSLCGPTRFSRTADLYRARARHAAALLRDGRVFIIGGASTYAGNGTGTDDQRGYNQTAELYDPANNSFSSEQLPHSVTGASATVLADGRVLIAGGWDAYQRQTTTAASLYDPVTGAVTDTGSLSVAREWHTATLLGDGTVLVAGGVPNPFIDAGTASAELYDPSTGTFSRLPDMSTPRWKHTATLLRTGKVLLVSLSSSELYDPVTRSFGSAASTTAAWKRHTATRLNDGRVLLAGGEDASSVYATAEAALYDPATNAHTRLLSDLGFPPMLWKRHGHTATLLPDGRVLVAGGSEGPWSASYPNYWQYSNTTEVFDPSTGRFTWGPLLTRARSDHAATLTADGRVLLTGGDGPLAGVWYDLYIGTELSDSGACTSVYMGCYVDTPTRGLPVALMSSGATVESCVAAARAAGYAYAGVQYGGWCFAGNAVLYNRAYEADCDMPCTASPSEICGGPWRNSVYTTSSAATSTPALPPAPALLYQGCYVDAPARALPVQLMSSGATVESCIDTAVQQGFRYAGVQYHGECYAGNALAYNRAYEVDCDTPCDAESAETCGGSWRNSVYATSLSAPPPPAPPPLAASLYQGCFIDDPSRTLPVLLDQWGVTVERCVDTARQQGYRYAGVQAGFQCFAGNALPSARAAEADCNIACAGNAAERCGGTWRNAVYATPATNPVRNPGFEEQLTGWTPSGTVRAVASPTPVHSGASALQAGSYGPTQGDSSVSQTFTVPAGGATLSFWYYPRCALASISLPTLLDWATATLRDEWTGQVVTLLPRVCLNDGRWHPIAYSLSAFAGRPVTLTLTNHDDGYSTYPTYTLFDDVLVR